MQVQDKDFKYMAMNDMLKELNTPGLSLDNDCDRRVANVLVAQLKTKGDLQELAIKW